MLFDGLEQKYYTSLLLHTAMPRAKKTQKDEIGSRADKVQVDEDRGKKRARKVTKNEKKANLICAVMDYLYPDPPVPLNGESDYQLLVAIVLSAQTTDVAVNAATVELFKQAPTPNSMVMLGLEKITALIQTLGLYKNKAKSVFGLSQQLLDSYKGDISNVETKEQLMALPGVGPKTASVFLSQARGVPSFAVDTHVHRLANRWGLSKETKDANVVQRDLEAIFPRNKWSIMHLQFIYYGREYCVAKNHQPRLCPVCAALMPSTMEKEAHLRALANDDIDVVELVERCALKANVEPPRSPTPKNILLYSRRKEESPQAKIIKITASLSDLQSMLVPEGASTPISTSKRR